MLTEIDILFANRGHQLFDRRAITRLPGFFDGIMRFFDFAVNAHHHVAHRLLIFVAQFTQLLFLFAAEIQALVGAGGKKRKHSEHWPHTRTRPARRRIRFVKREKQHRAWLNRAPRLLVTPYLIRNYGDDMVRNRKCGATDNCP